MNSIWKLVAAVAALGLVAGCVSFPPPPPARRAPAIADGWLVARDGARLGLNVWRADKPSAVVIALHGMNDYARAFEGLGGYLSQEAGITLYAYDQRGFGRSPEFGHWRGTAAYIADLKSAIAAVRADNPGLPVYVLGHSMGAAVAMAAAAQGPLDVDGAILASPGVWGASRLPITHRAALNISASLAPGKTLTGRRAHRQSTDNLAVLREMLADPHVIKATRLDAVLGVVRVMGRAWRVSDDIGGRILFLYGEKDEIIPVKAMVEAAERLCGEVDLRAYPEGWHLLFRDLEAAAVWRDVGAWVLASAGKDAAGPNGRFGPAAFACASAGTGDSASAERPRRTRTTADRDNAGRGVGLGSS